MLDLWPVLQSGHANQLFSSELMRLSNSSNAVSPLIISPLMKKVGVELHLQHLGGELLVGGDLVEQRLVLQAVLDLPAG